MCPEGGLRLPLWGEERSLRSPRLPLTVGASEDSSLLDCRCLSLCHTCWRFVHFIDIFEEPACVLALSWALSPVALRVPPLGPPHSRRVTPSPMPGLPWGSRLAGGGAATPLRSPLAQTQGLGAGGREAPPSVGGPLTSALLPPPAAQGLANGLGKGQEPAVLPDQRRLHHARDPRQQVHRPPPGGPADGAGDGGPAPAHSQIQAGGARAEGGCGLGAAGAGAGDAATSPPPPRSPRAGSCSFSAFLLNPPPRILSPST